MRNILEKKQTLSINGIEYTIEGVVGKGSSCVVYNTTRQVKGKKQNCLLKEFNPEGFDLDRPQADNCIKPNTKEQARFDRELKRFGSSVNLMIELYNDVDPNNTPFIDSASCDSYVVIQRLFGNTFEELKVKNLKELLTRIKAIAEIIGKYHEKGLLHLDLKPENIFCLPNDPNRVQIIDYDSVVRLSYDPNDKRSNAMYILDDDVDIRFSSNWAAELNIKDRKQICPATNLFAIGEMLYYKLFDNNHSDLIDRKSNGNFDFSKALLLNGANPALLPKLTDFFRKTLSANPMLRYQSAKKLIDAINGMLDLVDPPFIIDNLEGPPAFFVGRERKIADTHKQLKDYQYLFIQGVGGIGKSAFAISYANKYRTDYDVVCLTKSTDPVFEIRLGNYDDSGKQSHDHKWEAIFNACKRNRVLMIFDNAEKLDEKKDIEKLMTLPCDKLFLTRNPDVPKKNRRHLVLSELSENDALEIFRNYCKFPEKYEDKVRSIVNWIKISTYAIVLAAGMITSGKYSIDEFVEKIKGNDGDSDKVIEMLFNMSDIDENGIAVLASLALLPPSGIRKQLIKEWSEHERKISVLYFVNDLINTCWVQESNYGTNRVVTLHPLIEEIALNKLCGDPMACVGLLEWLTSCSCKCECDNELKYIVSAVAKKILESISVNSENAALIGKSTADFLIASCQVCGGFKSQIKRLERAITIYHGAKISEKTM